MKVKDFAKLAIKNGYDESRCNGWDWIRQNLSMLDFIFKTTEYKKHNGMKYLCMPLIRDQEELTELEENVLGTAWYLNNERERKEKQQAYDEKMSKEGYLKLEENIVKKAYQDKKRLEVIGKRTNDWLTIGIKEIYKPFVNHEGHCYLMRPKARSRGISIYSIENGFCKLV